MFKVLDKILKVKKTLVHYAWYKWRQNDLLVSLNFNSKKIIYFYKKNIFNFNY